MNKFIKKEIIENNICLISIQREPVNALSFDFLYDLNDLFTDVNNDNSIRIVIFKSNLDHFCAGADLKERKIMSRSDASGAY